MRALGAVFCLLLVGAAPARGAQDEGAAAQIQSILSLPDDQFDYGRAKLAFDRIVDPSIDADVASAEIDRLARAATTLAGGASRICFTRRTRRRKARSAILL